MKNTLKILSLALMVIFASCDPDEEDTDPSNSGNGGGGNTGNAVSYPEIVNLLAGNWYGQSAYLKSTIDNSVTVLDQVGTESIGYITFSSTPSGNSNFGVFDSDFLQTYFPIVSAESNVSSYNYSITNIDQTWGGVGPYYMISNNVSYAEGIPNVNQKYCIVKFSTPFYNIQTPTISYVFSGAVEAGPDITSPMIGGGLQLRIKSINSNTLVLLADILDNHYIEYNFVKL